MQGGARDVPNSRMYSELRELDLRAEQYTNRKKAEICDVNQQLDLQTRTLRLHLYNQHHNQAKNDPLLPPAWSFFIYGQFLDQEQANRTAYAPGVAAEAEKKAATAQKFWTSSMASIHIKIASPTDSSAPTEEFLWQRNRHVGQHKESLEIHRYALCAFAKLCWYRTICSDGGHQMLPEGGESHCMAHAGLGTSPA